MVGDLRDFAVFETTKGAWLLHAESHNLFKISDKISPVENSAAARPSPDFILQSLAGDLEVLAAAGFLASYNATRLESARPTEGAPLALNINLTALCNLGCTYCFAQGGDYGRITGKLNTTVDVDDILAFIAGNASSGDAVRFEFFGGEPMMNFDTIEALCLRSEELAKELDIRFHYRISTNLTTRLTERELALFERFRFTVSVSIDGPQATHDRNRPNKAGRGSFAAILNNCRAVRERSDDITLVARMTYVPHPDSSLVDDVEALHSMNLFDWFQILPVTVSKELVGSVFGDAFGDLSFDEVCRVCAEKVDREYERLGEGYAALFRDDNRFQGILEIETVIRMILEGEVANGHCSGGRNYFTFSPDRSIMPCHRLVGERGFQAGTFGEPLDEAALGPWRLSINETPVCRDCSIRYICGGGCKQENFVATGAVNRPDPEKCRFQFRLVQCAIQALADSGSAFRTRRRDALRDLFVSCGRPTLKNGRPATLSSSSLEHLATLDHAFPTEGREYGTG